MRTKHSEILPMSVLTYPTILHFTCVFSLNLYASGGQDLDPPLHPHSPGLHKVEIPPPAPYGCLPVG